MNRPEINHNLENYGDSKSYISENMKKIIIFLAVSFFSIHTLVYILQFRLNFPFGDDNHTYSFAYEYLSTGSWGGLFGITEISDYASHLIYSLKLLALPNLIYNSFDVVNFYYLQWIIMSLTLLVLFLILKKTDKRLYWVLIPISVFIYCPIYNTGYWIFSSIMWLMVTFCIVLTVYLLNKEKITNSIFLSSVSIAIFSTFFSLIGIMAWFAGLICLAKRNNEGKIRKKYLAAWIAVTVIIGFIFVLLVTSLEVIQFDEETYLVKFFSIEGISFVTTYLATSYRFGTENIFFSKIIGIITLILSGYFFYYFIRIKKNVQKSYPWLLFILLGIVSGIIIAIGRMGLEGHDGNESFYKAVSQFSQIGILVLVSMLMLEIKKNRTKKFTNIKLCLCILIIISQMVFLIPSYYASWVKAEHYYDVKNEYVDCYSLTHGTECLDWTEYSRFPHPFEQTKVQAANFWLENKMSVFGDANFNQQNGHDLNKFRTILENNPDIEFGFGKIERINGQLVSEQSIVIEENFVNIEGWILDESKSSVDSIFLMIDNKPLLKYEDFVSREHKEYDYVSEKNSGWNIIFLSGYVEKGCHEISIIGLSNETLVKLQEKIEICMM